MKLLSPTRLRVLGGGLFLTGSLFLAISAQLTPKTPLQDFTVATYRTPVVRKSLPMRIVIGQSIDLPVELTAYGPVGWQVASQAASIASTSAYPGESGNIVIYSHNLRRLFGKLAQIKIGDRVVIQTEDGSTHTYSITSRDVVAPDQISSLLPTQTEVLTLYTCTGLFDTKRLVVRALPISP